MVQAKDSQESHPWEALCLKFPEFTFVLLSFLKSQSVIFLKEKKKKSAIKRIGGSAPLHIWVQEPESKGKKKMKQAKAAITSPISTLEYKSKVKFTSESLLLCLIIIIVWYL